VTILEGSIGSTCVASSVGTQTSILIDAQVGAVFEGLNEAFCTQSCYHNSQIDLPGFDKLGPCLDGRIFYMKSQHFVICVDVACSEVSPCLNAHINGRELQENDTKGSHRWNDARGSRSSLVCAKFCCLVWLMYLTVKLVEVSRLYTTKVLSSSNSSTSIRKRPQGLK
jgi:hypothetical protein